MRFSHAVAVLALVGATALICSSGSLRADDATRDAVERLMPQLLSDDGRITVTLQDGKDAPEQKFEAKSFAELRKDHPDVAGRVENLLPEDGRHGFWFRLAPFSRERRREGAAPEDGRRPPTETPSPEAGAAPPSLGIEWSPASDALRAQLDLADGALVAESVVPGSLAEKLGLRRFDVLLSLNGRAVAQSADVRAALDGPKAGDAVKALVVRKGRRETFEARK